MKRIILTFSIIVALLGLSSCANQQFLVSKTAGDIQDLLKVDSNFQHTIRPDDKLSLSIWNHDDISLGSVFSIYNSNESFGKWVLVDQNGFAQLPKIGKVKLGGLTCTQAADTLLKLYALNIKDPIIVVKILNRKVTILGEVRSPGNFILDEEQVNLLEIIGRAQGFTNYANMEEILLVRNNRNYSLDLQKMDDLQLHNLLLQSDDILVVTATRGKAFDQKAPRLIPVASTITAIAVVASFLIAR
jgi:polysaccharide export outer membrane protein